MDITLNNEENAHLMFDTSLRSNGHDISKHSIYHVFNSFAKNFAKDLKHTIDSSNAKKQEKVVKLSGSGYRN